MRALVVALTALPLLAASPAFARDRHRDHPSPDLLRIGPDDFGSVFEMHTALRGGRLGVQVSSMTDELREAMGAPADAGILVNRVLADTAAQKAGIKPGDIIVEVAGEPISEVGDVWKALANQEGDVAVEVIRDKRRTHLTARIEKREPPAAIFGVNAELKREVENLRAKVRDLEKRLEKLEKKR